MKQGAAFCNLYNTTAIDSNVGGYWPGSWHPSPQSTSTNERYMGGCAGPDEWFACITSVLFLSLFYIHIDTRLQRSRTFGIPLIFQGNRSGTAQCTGVLNVLVSYHTRRIHCKKQIWVVIYDIILLLFWYKE